MKVRASVKREVRIAKLLEERARCMLLIKKILDLNRGKDSYENSRYRHSG